jgi:flavin-dependent dehydrogenase
MGERDERVSGAVPGPEGYDCTIHGGGPAGALLAGILAGWGRSVALVHRAGPRAVPEETMVAGARERLERHGLLEIVDRFGFEGTARQGAVWGNDELEWRQMTSAGQRGLKVDRDVFDRELREWARARGARVLEGNEAIRADSKCLVAATGKAVGEPFTTRVESELPGMVALSADVVPPRDTDATVIEALPEGWLWWLPLRDGGVRATLFVDQGELRERGADDLWQAALSHALGVARGCVVSSGRGTDTTPRLRTCTGPALLVGDAASNIDPLSSQGLEKALASAEDCAFAVNTVLAHPERSALVHARRRAWERRLFEAHAREALTFYRNEERFADQPFWRVRHAAAESFAPPVPPLPRRMAPNPELVPGVLLERKGRLLEEAPGYRLGGGDEVWGRVGRMELAPVLAILGRGMATSDVLARAGEHPALYALSPGAVLAGLTELIRLGVLIEAAE